jgi:hypothetical protein
MNLFPQMNVKNLESLLNRNGLVPPIGGMFCISIEFLTRIDAR